MPLLDSYELLPMDNKWDNKNIKTVDKAEALVYNNSCVVKRRLKI